MKHLWNWVVAVAVCVLVAVPVASASHIYNAPVTGANLIGFRSETAGDLFEEIITAGDYEADDENGTISWVITSLGGGTWQYQYSFTGFQTPGISHFILDLTDDCVPDNPGCVVGLSGVFGEFDGTSPSNPSMPGTIIGVKFDFGAETYEFTSNRSPVWGDFYIKGGNTSAAWNVGLEDHDSESISAFIARPNSANPPDEVIPEPSTWLLMGAGLTAVGWFRRKRVCLKRQM